MPLIRTTSGKTFDARDGEVLLDAALRASVTLAYSCKTGRCSTCKGRLKSGTTTVVHDETGLSPAQREAGWILTCSRSATSDVELEADDLSEAHLAAAKTLPCRIDALERLAGDVLKVVLRLPPATPFDFRPGQYIDVIGPAGVRRSYSIANAPTEARRIELHIRQVADGVLSDYWFSMAKVNDLLRMNGPLGTFYLRDVDGVDLVFLATGTGIAPVKAMLEGLAGSSSARKPNSVSLYWGGPAPRRFVLGQPCRLDRPRFRSRAFESPPRLGRRHRLRSGCAVVRAPGLDQDRCLCLRVGSHDPVRPTQVARRRFARAAIQRRCVRVFGILKGRR